MPSPSHATCQAALLADRELGASVLAREPVDRHGSLLSVIVSPQPIRRRYLHLSRTRTERGDAEECNPAPQRPGGRCRPDCQAIIHCGYGSCLLYTSDAADDLLCV